MVLQFWMFFMSRASCFVIFNLESSMTILQRQRCVQGDSQDGCMRVPYAIHVVQIWNLCLQLNGTKIFATHTAKIGKMLKRWVILNHFIYWCKAVITPIFSTDIQMGWWLSCIGRSVLDLMFLSAPCQPWSSASSGKGLLSEDGWSSLVALVVAAYLRPKLVGWEQVSGIQKHKHWSILKSVAYRCGFEFVVESKCNLSNVSPQNRERLLVLLRDRRVVSGDIDLRIFDFPSFALKSMTGFKADYA